MEKKLKHKKNNRNWASYRARKNAEKIEWEMYQKGGLIEESEEEIHQSYLSLLEKMKQQGIYEEDHSLKTQKTKTDFERLGENQLRQTEVPGKRNRFVSKAGRFAAVLCVSVLGVFAVSITSEGNRKYLLDTANYLLGNDVKININNSEANDENEGKDLLEEKAIAEIEQTMGVEVPYFIYRPHGFQFIGYNIYENDKIVSINYGLNDCITNLYINTDEESAISNNLSVPGDAEVVETIKVDGIEIVVFDILEQGDETWSHVAQWKYNNYFYQIVSKVDKSEFKKIIKYLKF